MKTSNKILIATAIIIVVGLFLQSYILRNAYQKALLNPKSQFVKFDLKEPKSLNIKHHWNVKFKKADKFYIEIFKEYKDSLKYNYVGDSLNLDGRNAGEMIINTANLPKLTFDSEKGSELYVYINEFFNSSLLDVQFIKACHFTIIGSQFERAKIKSNESLQLILENCDIKNLNLNLPKRSEITLNYSKIGSKNFNLGDSCSVKVTGNYPGAIPGQYFGYK